MDLPSTKPYMIRAIYEWCVDNGYTPYLSVTVSAGVKVPRQFVRDGQIVLNIGPEASQHLFMGNEELSFSARFSGVAQDVRVPMDNVAAIYAKENGQGMGFEVAVPDSETVEEAAAPQEDSVTEPPDEPAPGGKPRLRRIK